jgi:hypothetical protein
VARAGIQNRHSGCQRQALQERATRLHAALLCFR